MGSLPAKTQCRFSQGAGCTKFDLYSLKCPALAHTHRIGQNFGRLNDLCTHLLSRNDQRVQRGAPTRFERGTEELLLQIREMSRRSEVKLKVYVVQPGLSKAQASHGQLMLLAVTERFLSDTYEIPFSFMCSP